MGSLYDRDRLAYADTIYQLARDVSEDYEFISGLEEKEVAEQILRRIIKLGQTPVIFTVFEEVFRKWLELLPRDYRQVCCRYSFLPTFLTDNLVLPVARPSV